MNHARIVRLAFSAFIIAASILGLVNVMGDNSAVLAQARAVACGAGRSCRQASEARNPFFHTYGFEDEQGHAQSITCRRVAYLVGAWTCSNASVAPAPTD